MDRVDINHDCAMILCKFFKDTATSMDRIKACKEVVVTPEKVSFPIRRSNLLMNTFDDFTSTVLFEDTLPVFLTKYMKREDRYFRFMFIDNYTAANRKVSLYDCLPNLHALARNSGNQCKIHYQDSSENGYEYIFLSYISNAFAQPTVGWMYLVVVGKIPWESFKR